MDFGGKIFSVSEINGYIKAVLDSDILLSGLCIEGELSNYKRYPSGHCYFSIKDKESSLKCMMFRYQADKLRFIPQNGMTLLCYGNISAYERDGVYQLYCDRLVPAGQGELSFAFEQLKEKLYKEGLFDTTHKKPLPRFPSTVAVVTSAVGAAVRDIVRVSRERWPMAEIKILPVSVQGERAAQEIAGAIRFCNKYKIGDVIITGRGGGSMEDLWCFNDEALAREIYNSEIPVVSAVGHEPDFTISDFVADVRAATPSNGAELTLPSSDDINRYINSLAGKLKRALNMKIENSELRLKSLAERPVYKNPVAVFKNKAIYLDSLYSRIEDRYYRIISEKANLLAQKALLLDAVSPLKTLNRGYGLITDPSETNVIKSVKKINPQDRLSIKLTDGKILCNVESVICEENPDGK